MTKYFALAKQSAWGTEATPDKFFYVVSESYTPRVEVITPDVVTLKETPFGIRVREWMEGDFTVPIDFNYMGWFFKGLLKDVTTSQPDATNAPNTYEHTFTPTEDAFLDVFTVEKNLDDFLIIRSVNTSIVSTTLEAPVGEIITATIGLHGNFFKKMTSALSPSYPSLEICTSNDATLTLEGTSVKVRAFRFTLENSLGIDESYILGTDAYVQPTLNWREGTIEVDMILEDSSIFDYFEAGTELSSLVFDVVGKEIEAGYNYELKVTSTKSIIVEWSSELRRERLIQSATFRLLDMTNKLSILLRNTTSGY